MTTSAPEVSHDKALKPRLRLDPAGRGHGLLDGGWWPRSNDPATELPGLVLAIDALRGPVLRLMLPAAGWSSHPRRLAVAGRVVRLGYFTSQPEDLLIAICGRTGARVDLLTIPPSTPGEIADLAMTIAATAGNRVRAQHIVAAATSGLPAPSSEDTWESEGGRLGGPRVLREAGR